MVMFVVGVFSPFLHHCEVEGWGHEEHNLGPMKHTNTHVVSRKDSIGKENRERTAYLKMFQDVEVSDVCNQSFGSDNNMYCCMTTFS